MFIKDLRVPLFFCFRFSQTQLILEASCFERRVPTVVVGCVVKQPLKIAQSSRAVLISAAQLISIIAPPMRNNLEHCRALRGSILITHQAVQQRSPLTAALCSAISRFSSNTFTKNATQTLLSEQGLCLHICIRENPPC